MMKPFFGASAFALLMLAAACTVNDQMASESGGDTTASKPEMASDEPSPTPTADPDEVSTLDDKGRVRYQGTAKTKSADVYQINGVFGKRVGITLSSQNPDVTFLVESGGIAIPTLGLKDAENSRHWEAYPQANAITVTVKLAPATATDPAEVTAPYTLEVVKTMDLVTGGYSPIGPRWSLGTLRGYTGALEGDKPFFQLDTTGKVQGQGGCNAFNGAYTISPKEIGFRGLLSTKKSCPMMALENKMMDALASAKSWRISGSTLTLYSTTDMGGGEVASFVAVEK